jgi:hypothetical protein
MRHLVLAGCLVAQPLAAAADPRCAREAPPPIAFEPGHAAACWHADVEAADAVA